MAEAIAASAGDTFATSPGGEGADEDAGDAEGDEAGAAVALEVRSLDGGVGDVGGGRRLVGRLGHASCGSWMIRWRVKWGRTQIR